MAYKFSTTSLTRLQGVNPQLVGVTKRALEVSKVDFMVVEGLRTLARQKQLVASGASQTLKSNHLTGRAVDLAPVRNGKIDWNNLEDFVRVADAMREAAIKEKVNLRWGACWIGRLNDYPEAKAAVKAYADHCRANKKRPFWDYPHFELN